MSQGDRFLDSHTGESRNLSTTLSDLTPNTLYDIRVRAGKTVDGTMVWGKNSGVYRRWLKTVAVSFEKTANSITVNITPVEGATGYEVHVSEYKDMTDETVKRIKATTLLTRSRVWMLVRNIMYACVRLPSLMERNTLVP